MKKYAKTLAKDYGLGKSKEDYYDCIIMNLVNGNRKDVRGLFNQMKKSDKKDFLINHLDLKQGYHKSVLNICIEELTS